MVVSTFGEKNRAAQEPQAEADKDFAPRRPARTSARCCARRRDRQKDVDECAGREDPAGQNADTPNHFAAFKSFRYFRREAISLFPSILVSGAAFLNDAASRKKLPDAGRPAKIVPKRARRHGCRPAALTQLCRVLWRFARSRDLFAGWRPAQRNRSKRRCTISRSSSIAASEASALSASFRVLPFCRTLKTFDLDHDAIMRRSRYLNA